VGGVELAALAHHLRLDPDPEAKPERLDLAGDSFDPAGELGQIGRPVAKGTGVTVASTEPAVVENENLDPQPLRRGRDLQQLGLVEVVVRRLPVVDDDRPRGIAPDAARESIAIETVIRIRERPQAGLGIDENRLRRAELGAGVKGPG
jgi:hypothetical protein